MTPRLALCASLLCCAALAACSHRTTNVIVEPSTKITEGQQLIDLQRALDQGAVTQREYDEIRAKLLRR
jgi:hypothetical protein